MNILFVIRVQLPNIIDLFVDRGGRISIGTDSCHLSVCKKPGSKRESGQTSTIWSCFRVGKDEFQGEGELVPFPCLRPWTRRNLVQVT